MDSKVEILNFWTCVFLDPPSGTFTPTMLNCSAENCIFYECQAYGKYWFQDYNPDSVINGHFVCVLIFITTVFTGTFGIVTNVLNIILIRKSYKETSVKYLLMVLAVVDLVACISGTFYSYTIISILENLNRGKSVYQEFRIACIIFLISRTASIYVTILVTIERYIVVAFPHEAPHWLSQRKSCVYLTMVGVLSVLLNLSQILNPTVSKVEANDIFPPNSHVENFPYVIKDDPVASKNLREVLVIINYVAPFPLYLLFNGILYKSIHHWKLKRGRMSSNVGNNYDVNVATMFSVVVIIALLCHTVSCDIFFLAKFKGFVYRELIVTQMLSVVFGSSINFLVYYLFGNNFRQEFHKLLSAAYANRRACVPEMMPRGTRI